MNADLLPPARLITDSLRLAATPAGIRARLAASSDLDWPLVARHADGHTLAPLLYHTWRQADALDLVPGPIRERFARAYRDNATRNLNVRQDLLDAHQLLSAAAVPHLVLKGWPLVERLYSGPAQRYLSDHDFLVPADRARIGHQALLAAGFRPLPQKDEWIEKHLPSVWRNEGYAWDGYLYDPLYPRPVELHIRLWEQGWRGLRVRNLPDLWADPSTVTVAGVPMQVLSNENTVVHLAMHFAGHLVEREARLNQLLDLARFTADTEALDWERVTGRAVASGVARFVFASLFLAHEIFGSPRPPARAWQSLAAHTPRAFRDWLAWQGVADALTCDHRRRDKGQDYRLTFLAARSLAERLGILRFAALPPAGQLLAKYRVRQRWLAPLLYPRHLAERLRAYGRGASEQGEAK